MSIKTRRDENNHWGFVETFKPYRFGDVGSVTALVGVTPEGKFAEPHILRKGVFIPLADVEKEGDVGLKAYMRAKKPIYSMLADGFIISLKCYMNYVTGEFIEDKSGYDIYTITGQTAVTSVESRLSTTKLMVVPKNIDELAKKLLKEMVKYQDNREEFLLSRLK